MNYQDVRERIDALPVTLDATSRATVAQLLAECERAGLPAPCAVAGNAMPSAVSTVLLGWGSDAITACVSIQGAWVNWSTTKANGSGGPIGTGRPRDVARVLALHLPAGQAEPVQPIPMILHCPACGLQHIDAPDPSTGWDNTVHRSHTCRVVDGGCGTIWRPADVPTTGVLAIETRGQADTWPHVGEIEIFVNGRPRTVALPELSYEDAVRLAGKDPRVVHSVIYTRAERGAQGTLWPGSGSIRVQPGTRVEVAFTGNA